MTVSVETSAGRVDLLPSEVPLLERLIAGAASHDEGLAFYGAVTGRGGAFPAEWEIPVLKATIVAMPDRQDLIARLALLEGATRRPPAPEADAIAVETSLGLMGLAPDEAVEAIGKALGPDGAIVFFALAAALATTFDASVDVVVVLKGSGSVVAAPGRVPVINPTGNARLGMGASIAAGVSARSKADGWLVLPADMPLVQSSTLLQVAAAVSPAPAAPTASEPAASARRTHIDADGERRALAHLDRGDRRAALSIHDRNQSDGSCDCLQ